MSVYISTLLKEYIITSHMVIQFLEWYMLSQKFHVQCTSDIKMWTLLLFYFVVTQHGVENTPGEQMRLTTQGNVKLSSIRDIMDQVSQIQFNWKNIKKVFSPFP